MTLNTLLTLQVIAIILGVISIVLSIHTSLMVRQTLKNLSNATETEVLEVVSSSNLEPEPELEPATEDEAPPRTLVELLMQIGTFLLVLVGVAVVLLAGAAVGVVGIWLFFKYA